MLPNLSNLSTSSKTAVCPPCRPNKRSSQDVGLEYDRWRDALDDPDLPEERKRNSSWWNEDVACSLCFALLSEPSDIHPGTEGETNVEVVVEHPAQIVQGEDGKSVLRSPCNHPFHLECLAQHVVTVVQLGRTPACPICRVALPASTIARLGDTITIEDENSETEEEQEPEQEEEPRPLLISYILDGASNSYWALWTIQNRPDTDLEERDPNTGDTALVAAVRRGSRNVVEALVRAGANLNARVVYNRTALMVAVGLPSADIVMELTAPEFYVSQPLEEIFIGATDLNGDTALDIAFDKAFEELRENPLAYEIMLDEDGDATVGWEKERAVLRLVRSGAEADGLEGDDRDNKRTVLMRACRTRMLSVVEELVQQPEMNLDAQDIEGRTALMLVVRQGQDSVNLAIFGELLNFGANTKLKDYSFERQTALDMAVELGHALFAERLRQAARGV